MNLVSFRNLGNTCYINSILQNIIYDPLFRKKINNSEDESIFTTELKRIILKNFIAHLIIYVEVKINK